MNGAEFDVTNWILAVMVVIVGAGMVNLAYEEIERILKERKRTK